MAPLADWTEREVWDYIFKYDLPYHPLHDRGFPSIGCTHCTQPVPPGARLAMGGGRIPKRASAGSTGRPSIDLLVRCGGVGDAHGPVCRRVHGDPHTPARSRAPVPAGDRLDQSLDVGPCLPHKERWHRLSRPDRAAA